MNKFSEAALIYMLKDLGPEVTKVKLQHKLCEEEGIDREDELKRSLQWYRRLAAKFYRLEIEVEDEKTGFVTFSVKGAPTFLEKLSLIYECPVEKLIVDRSYLKEVGISEEEAGLTTPEIPKEIYEILDDVSTTDAPFEFKKPAGVKSPHKKTRYLTNDEFCGVLRNKQDPPMPQKTLQQREKEINKAMAAIKKKYKIKSKSEKKASSDNKSPLKYQSIDHMEKPIDHESAIKSSGIMKTPTREVQQTQRDEQKKLYGNIFQSDSKVPQIQIKKKSIQKEVEVLSIRDEEKEEIPGSPKQLRGVENKNKCFDKFDSYRKARAQRQESSTKVATPPKKKMCLDSLDDYEVKQHENVISSPDIFDSDETFNSHINEIYDVNKME